MVDLHDVCARRLLTSPLREHEIILRGHVGRDRSEDSTGEKPPEREM